MVFFKTNGPILYGVCMFYCSKCSCRSEHVIGLHTLTTVEGWDNFFDSPWGNMPCTYEILVHWSIKKVTRNISVVEYVTAMWFYLFLFWV